jgi:hypothetical protein
LRFDRYFTAIRGPKLLISRGSDFIRLVRNDFIRLVRKSHAAFLAYFFLRPAFSIANETAD